MTYPEIVQAMQDGKCRGGKLPEDIGTIVLDDSDHNVIGGLQVVWEGSRHPMNNLAYTLRDDWEMVDEVTDSGIDLPFTAATDVICIETSFLSPHEEGRSTDYLSVTEWPNRLGADVVTVECNTDGRTEQRFGLNFETLEHLAEAVGHLKNRMADRDEA